MRTVTAVTVSTELTRPTGTEADTPGSSQVRRRATPQLTEANAHQAQCGGQFVRASGEADWRPQCLLRPAVPAYRDAFQSGLRRHSSSSGGITPSARIPARISTPYSSGLE